MGLPFGDSRRLRPPAARHYLPSDTSNVAAVHPDGAQISGWPKFIGGWSSPTGASATATATARSRWPSRPARATCCLGPAGAQGGRPGRHVAPGHGAHGTVRAIAWPVPAPRPTRRARSDLRRPQNAVWHKHFTRDELVSLAGPHWRVDQARYPGSSCGGWRSCWCGPFAGPEGRTMRWPDRSDALSIGMRGETTGPKRGYEILVTPAYEWAPRVGRWRQRSHRCAGRRGPSPLRV
jgi:hypothetical protein